MYLICGWCLSATDLSSGSSGCGRIMLNVLHPEGVHLRKAGEGYDARMIDSDADYEAERRSLLAQRELLQKQWMEELEVQKRLLREYQQQNLGLTQEFDLDTPCLASQEADAAVEEDEEEVGIVSGEKANTKACLQLSLVIFSHFVKIFSGFVLLFAVVFTSIFGCCAVSTSQLLLVSSALPLFFYFRGKGQG